MLHIKNYCWYIEGLNKSVSKGPPNPADYNNQRKSRGSRGCGGGKSTFSRKLADKLKEFNKRK